MSNSIKKSNTYRRDRNETEFDTLDKARSLKRRIARYVMNDKKVPKRWRYIEGVKAIDYAIKIRDCVSRANDIMLDPEHFDQEKADERLKYQDYALSYCNILQLQLDDIIEECEGATHDNMAPIIDELIKLIRMTVAWKNSDKNRMGNCKKKS